jgi:NADPH-dependent 2,4-dienoyl-CoA reductase/sulfur reductase-like enzyme/peroxiredoxin family protein/rhodanese-related sulfurtransferase/TusA-related sulfurtransferase
MKRYLIIGGVAGGATTAARLRRNDEKADIVLFERGEYISYANCGLPYYIGDTIPEREKLFVQTPKGFGMRFNIDVRTKSEVVKIDRAGKTIEIRKTDTGETYREKYDRLVLSPGAIPLKPPIPGINDGRIFTLRSVPDTDRIKTFIEQQKPKRAVIVGAGFIGLEMAENLHNRGIFVTIVEMLDQVMNVLDFEMASMVHRHLKTKNVELYLKDGVASFSNRDDGRIAIRLASGKELATDMVILSIGVKPEIKLAKEAGLEIGELGGISVDDHLLTNDSNIYALGDAIEVTNPIIGKKVLIPLAGPANKQGRIVADNIVFGNNSKYEGTIGTAIAKVFDLTVASTGASEKLLRKEGIPYIASITHSGSHAGYYPNAIPLSIKLLFSPGNGKILGSQIVGYEGVDKRIDVIAALLMCGKTIFELEAFEHAYAPPYSSAKDPVNVAGFVAENILRDRMKIVQWYDVNRRDPSATVLLDVRTVEEYKLGTIGDAINIPIDSLRSRLSELPNDKSIIVFCGVGLRAYIAIRILSQNGFTDIRNLSGGYKTYEHVAAKQSNEDIYQGDFIGKNDDIYQANVEQKAVYNRTIYESDATGLQCPGPIMRLKVEMDRLNPGDRLRIRASDPGFYTDVKSWCNVTGNLLVSLDEEKGIIVAVIEKSTTLASRQAAGGGSNKTIIVFSDDFDRALASFVIANGALSMGRHVTMFFTFWGLNILKKKKHPKVKKDFMGFMFGKMTAKGSERLGMSKLNMAGAGPAMMRMRMKAKNIASLEEMIKSALSGGIEMIACQMSMDMMGVNKEELIDGVRIGGVATYLEEAEKSNLNLFI